MEDLSLMESLSLTILKPAPASRTGMRLADDERGRTFVEAVDSAGLAFAAGVRAGDILLAIRGEQPRGHEHAAALVLAAEGEVQLSIRRPQAAAADAADAADAGGSAQALESLGVDLGALGRPREAAVDAIAAEEWRVPAAIADADGTNAHALACRWCGCAILPAGRVTLLPDMAFALPPMPRARRAGEAADSPPAGKEEGVGVWRAGGKYAFDNLGVSKGVEEVADERGGGKVLRLLVCADCELGPFGWFVDDADRGEKTGEDVDFYVAVDRVRYL